MITLLVTQIMGTIQSLICQPTLSEEEQTALAISDRKPLVALSKEHNQLIHLGYKYENHPLELFTVLYINPTGTQAAMGVIDKDKIFQPTTSAMAFNKCRRGWHLTGRHRETGDIEVIRSHYGCFSYKNHDSELVLDLSVQTPQPIKTTLSNK